MTEKRRPRKLYLGPCSSGLVGLMVATSNAGFASAAIGAMRGGGWGIAHSVAVVARAKLGGGGFCPCLHVPVMELSSALIVPSYVAKGSSSFSKEPLSVVEIAGMPPGAASML